MGFRLKITLLYILTTAFAYCQQENDFVWPNGAEAAISLTYDDGLPSHVNTVIPMLNTYDLKGTFYPTLSSRSLYDEMEKWKALTKNGHELGNHTVYHPCRKSEAGMEWVKDYLDLDKYSTEQIVDEIELANNYLLALDGEEKRTFAYPCAHFLAGGKSYKDSLYNRFLSARGSSEEKMEFVKISEIDLYNLPSWAPNQNSADDLIGYIDEIIANKTFSSITFHGVGAEHMRVSKKAHEEMLKYLVEHKDEIWVATIKEISEFLRSKQIKK